MANINILEGNEQVSTTGVDDINANFAELNLKKLEIDGIATSFSSGDWMLIMTADGKIKKISKSDFDSYIQTGGEGTKVLYVWTRHGSGTVGNLSKICGSTDGMIQYISGVNGYIYKTTNGGDVWIQLTHLGIRTYASIACDSTGLKVSAVIQGVGILSSINGFDDAGFLFRLTTNWSDIVMTSDGNKIYACCQGTTKGVYLSINNGNTFNSLALNATQCQCITTSSDGSKIYVGENSGHIYVSTDSGSSFLQLSDTPKTWLDISCSSSGQYVYAVATSYQIYVSNDYGTSFLTSDTARYWTGIKCSSNTGKIVLACENNGNLYVSSDFGVSFQPQVSIDDTIQEWSSVYVNHNGTILTAATGEPTGAVIYKGV